MGSPKRSVPNSVFFKTIWSISLFFHSPKRLISGRISLQSLKTKTNVKGPCLRFIETALSGTKRKVRGVALSNRRPKARYKSLKPKIFRLCPLVGGETKLLQRFVGARRAQISYFLNIKSGAILRPFLFSAILFFIKRGIKVTLL